MSNDNVSNFFTHLEWNDATERLLAEWADIASCYVWIYDKGYRRFNRLNYKFSIPIIVLSTVTGTLSMSLNTLLPEEHITTGQVVLGGVNIFTGIITTLQNFFKYAQQSESNLNASIEWAKFERNIKIELSIERHSRKSAPDFIRIARHDYEKLLNNNPIVPVDIIDEFRKTVKDLDMYKPVLVKSLEATRVFNINESEEKSVVPSKISYLKRLASLIPGTKTFKQASGETAMGKLNIIKTNKNEIDNQTPKTVIHNRYNSDYLLSSSDATIREIAYNSKNNSPSIKDSSGLSLEKIKNNISQRELLERKVTVNTPQEPYTDLDDILVEPVIHS